MTHATKHTRRSAVPAAGLAALLLAGCSTGHIGESWQCPLAEGGSCDSVAAADPAVPKADSVRASALTEPLWRVRGGEADTVAPKAAAACDADCAGFDPFAWLAGLFDAGTAGGEKAAAPRPVRLVPPEVPAPAALPAEPEAAESQAGGEAAAGDLRTGEVVARIWIAPFVDAEGIYREASHVRVVLEPAGWRVE